MKMRNYGYIAFKKVYLECVHGGLINTNYSSLTVIINRRSTALRYRRGNRISAVVEYRY